MSAARGSWPLRFIASKNMRSDGYIQFPVARSAPVSCSLFARDGAEWSLLMSLLPAGIDVRGIVETSRSMPREEWLGIVLGGAGLDVVGEEEKNGIRGM
ncbi:hypothetical protein RRF57_010010 [Xylaria bambusicola]|uniref:Uncharacterized protein n=1 Tax=Xylaria bambusicola TaxID=326684 RepID=A0AAN7Z9B1_9PEZI